ncbi:tubby C-terminal-like domain-containing protein [Auriculariales sp. MPI-PUGE-AT-0066]|nr:tubby C-terminal-like domain-containing protein [Auriculariales sp. MPI-PUGE-AT-0066]
MDLYPTPHPVGVIPQFCQHRTPIALRIREKKVSWTGDDFKIKDAATGAVIFEVDGKAFSLHARKKFLDASGNHLFTLLKKHFHIHTTFEGQDPNEKTLFTIKSSFSLGTKLTATYTNPTTGQEEQLVLKGDFFDRKAEIKWGDVVVARISREFVNAGQLLFDQQTYVLTVAPNVDAALLVAFCVALDEKSNESS